MGIENKIFCTAPFTTLRIESYSDHGIIFKPGCVYFPQNKISTLDEYCNGTEMFEHRNNLLTGSVPSKGCFLCSDPEQMGLPSVRQALLKKSYASDKQSFKMLDVFFSNICNLGCLMCGPEWSTYISDERFKIKEISQRIKIKNNIEVILDTIDKLPDLECITFLGGEFFLFKQNEEIIKKIIDKKIKCTITTNATIANGDLYNILKKVSDIEFRFSLDGVGPINEFIRYPSNWNEIEKNIKLFINDFKQAEKVISTVVQPLNLQHLPELFEWANKNYLPVQIQIIASPKNLSWGILTFDEREQIINNFNLSKYQLTKNQLSLFDQIKEGINVPAFNDDDRAKGIKFLSKVLSYRKVSAEQIKNHFAVLTDFAESLIKEMNNETM